MSACVFAGREDRQIAFERAGVRELSIRKTRFLIAAFAAISVSAVKGQTPPGTNVGVLTCKLGPSIGLILGSRQRMACRFVPSGPFPPEVYTGVIGSIGLDVGITAGGAMAWGVFAPASGPMRGSLAGTYTGVSGSVGVGVGVGANVLFGGFHRSIALQPLSVEGSVGVNLSLGVSALTLTAAN
jgi:hypothetical protein